MKRLSAALTAVLLSAALAICLSSCQNSGDTPSTSHLIAALKELFGSSY